MSKIKNSTFGFIKTQKFLKTCLIIFVLISSNCKNNKVYHGERSDAITIFPCKFNEKWGYCNSNRNILITPEYDDVSQFYHNDENIYAIVKKDEIIYVIDTKGTRIGNEYDKIIENDKKLIMSNNGNLDFFNSNLNEFYKNDSITNIYDYGKVKCKNGYLGIIDEKMKLICNCEYQAIDINKKFKNHFLLKKEKSKIVYFNKNNQFKIENIENAYFGNSSTAFLFYMKNGKWNLIDSLANPVLTSFADRIVSLPTSNNYFSGIKSGVFMVFNSEGYFRAFPHIDYISDLSYYPSSFITSKNGENHLFYYDKEIFRGSNMGFLSEKIFYSKLSSNKYELFSNEKGVVKKLDNIRFDFFEKKNDVDIVFTNGSNSGYMNLKNLYFTGFKYDNMLLPSEGLIPVYKYNKGWGWINTDGEQVIDFNYLPKNNMGISSLSFRNGFVGVRKNGQNGFIDINGNEYY